MPRIFCFALCLGLLSSTSFAQLGGLDELYGEGVHRYFANDLSSADQILSQVVDGGSQDPRAHYFRGLARERLGFGGEMDFENGARLEAEGKRGGVDVGNALSRIQGSIRTKIEKARLDARIQVKQQQLMAEQARQYQNEAAPQVSPATPGSASPFPSESIPANDTGLAPRTPSATTPPTTTPAAPTSPDAPTDTSDPFGDDSAPADDTAPATGDDPFGAPTEEAPASDTPAADPFGETPAGDTLEDPFGGSL